MRCCWATSIDQPNQREPNPQRPKGNRGSGPHSTAHTTPRTRMRKGLFGVRQCSGECGEATSVRPRTRRPSADPGVVDTCRRGTRPSSLLEDKMLHVVTGQRGKRWCYSCESCPPATICSHALQCPEVAVHCVSISSLDMLRWTYPPPLAQARPRSEKQRSHGVPVLRQARACARRATQRDTADRKPANWEADAIKRCMMLKLMPIPHVLQMN